ncbi:MAG: tRNA lysidine(34) synthetase TilS [Pseudomonadota bacterium]|nr:tRNA lysidine(34) synthetase TilS [Sphingomonas sp.]MDQ3479020.1 tRNA lysidine(34) synthetase TilS [Pseudomonadota bacterium]
MPLEPAPELVTRFAARLDRLIPPPASLGLAVSGGGDSVALLLLAAAARPGKIEAATVDHSLRPQSEAEATGVADLCKRLGVPHATLKVRWEEQPETAIQERARAERYRLLGNWVTERGLAALATAHHLDDQAETLLMRLARGAGVRGLGAIRPLGPMPGSSHRLVRPLLGWSRNELRQICEAAGVEPVDDPSNDNEQFERVRVRRELARADWLDPRAVARSAFNLAAADAALDWAAAREWERSVDRQTQQIAYRPAGTPLEIRRRIVERAVGLVATESIGTPLRGREIDRLLELLAAGGTATLRGARCSGGEVWTFSPAPPRRPG